MTEEEYKYYRETTDEDIITSHKAHLYTTLRHHIEKIQEIINDLDTKPFMIVTDDEYAFLKEFAKYAFYSFSKMYETYTLIFYLILQSCYYISIIYLSEERNHMKHSKSRLEKNINDENRDAYTIDNVNREIYLLKEKTKREDALEIIKNIISKLEANDEKINTEFPRITHSDESKNLRKYIINALYLWYCVFNIFIEHYYRDTTNKLDMYITELNKDVLRYNNELLNPDIDLEKREKIKKLKKTKLIMIAELQWFKDKIEGNPRLLRRTNAYREISVVGGRGRNRR
jgi:hypothetical protein